MTGIEKSVEKIREDAEADYRRVVEEAKVQADAIMAEAAASALVKTPARKYLVAYS